MTAQSRARYLKLLEDILESSRRITYVLTGISKEEFCCKNNLDAQDIVAHRFSIIGEAAAVICHKYSELCEVNLLILMRQAKGMRNRLIHEYSSVNWHIVWETAQQNLPALIAEVEWALSAPAGEI